VSDEVSGAPAAGQPPAQDPIALATRALRHHDRSRREIDERLARAGIADEARLEALETLELLGYLDDARVAAARAEALAARGYGDEAIRHDLAGRGIGPDDAEQALAGLDPEADRAAALVADTGGGAATAARLRRKGFGEDTVAAASGHTFADAADGA
jgi:SOS response regulatory protein OraA/RecX